MNNMFKRLKKDSYLIECKVCNFKYDLAINTKTLEIDDETCSLFGIKDKFKPLDIENLPCPECNKKSLRVIPIRLGYEDTE